MDFTADPLLQGRLFSYTDTQVSRLGGPNFHELPINRPVCPFHNFQRDGQGRHDIHAGRVAYEPNSLGQERPLRLDGGNAGFQSVVEPIAGTKVRGRSPSFDDHFTMAALFYNSLSQPERDHLARAFQFELSKVEVPAIRQRMVDNLAHVDPKLAKKVAAPLGIDAPDARAAEGQSGYRSTRISLPIDESPALSMAVRPNAVKGIPTRKVALLVADGTDGASFKPLQAAIAAAGGSLKVIGPRLGTVKTAGNRQLAVDATYATLPSIAVDAVLIGGGKEAADALVRNGDAVHYVLEAYKHGKAVCALGEGVALLAGLGIQPNSEEQSMAANHPGVLLGVGIANTDTEALAALGERFIAAIAQHRFWDRPLMDAVPA
jgi:catalase